MKSNLKASGIYAIKNIVNGKRYIGSAVHLRKRRTRHFGDLRRGTHKNVILQNSWNKHGPDNFEFIVIEYCSKDMLLEREQHYLDKKSDYNICSIAGNTTGVNHTKAAKAKMSKFHSGKILSAEHKLHISKVTKGENNPNFGRKHTPAALAKMSASSIGRKTFLGKKHTEESKKKMSDFRMGKKLSDKTRAKMSASHMGMKQSPEAIAKASASLTGRKFSDEHRANLSRAKKLYWAKKKEDEQARIAAKPPAMPDVMGGV